jgi:hypothetical protein
MAIALSLNANAATVGFSVAVKHLEYRNASIGSHLISNPLKFFFRSIAVLELGERVLLFPLVLGKGNEQHGD